MGIGTCSGREIDKFTEFSLTPFEGTSAKAPLICECIAGLECRVIDYIEKYGLVILECNQLWVDKTKEFLPTLHAMVAACQTHSAPVTKITIIPRTSGALGYTLQVDEGEKYLMSKEEILNKIATLTGGRCAEEVIFHSITTGASNDIEQATKLARAMSNTRLRTREKICSLSSMLLRTGD